MAGRCGRCKQRIQTTCRPSTLDGCLEWTVRCQCLVRDQRILPDGQIPFTKATKLTPRGATVLIEVYDVARDLVDA